jgi:PAS domain S-box-containing protein
MKSRWQKGTISIFLAAAALVLPHAPLFGQTRPVRRVLIFNDLSTIASPGIAAMDHAINAVLQKSSYQIELYNESLEAILFSDEASQRQIRDSYIRKYQNRSPDVIITVGPSSLRFMVESHEKAFPNVPIIFCGSTEEMLEEMKLDSHFTGAWAVADPEKTLNLALRLKPDTRHVAVVGGVGRFDRAVESIVKENLRQYEAKLEFTYLTDLGMPVLLEQLKHLPSDTIVFHTSIMLDAAGTPFIDATQSVPMVASAANAPVFVLDDVDVGSGAVGGNVLGWADQAEAAAKMAVRVLNGEDPRNIPILKISNVNLLDWRALQRWGFREGDLPPDRKLLYHETSVWESQKWYIIGSIFLILAEAALIIEMIWLRARRRRVEDALEKSEEKFAIAFRHSPLAEIIMTAKDSRYIDVNESFLQMSGWTRDEVIGRTPSDLAIWVNPEERLAHVNRLESGSTIRNLESQFRIKNGEIRTGLRSAEMIEIDGEPCVLGVIADITEMKRAEEALSTISHRLIEAHEEERRWIACEIHDDISQRLALIALQLDVLGRSLSPSAFELSQKLKILNERALQIGKDIQLMSHRLHSSSLESLGLVSAAKGLCEELSELQGVEVDFHCENVPEDVPNEISLCLFRVLQEALQNAVKYSGVRYIQVSLSGLPNEIQLIVQDAGIGFDLKAPGEGRGLGLTSMKERLKLASGVLTINSHPKQGTTIQAAVPRNPKKKAAMAIE